MQRSKIFKKNLREDLPGYKLHLSMITTYPTHQTGTITKDNPNQHSSNHQEAMIVFPCANPDCHLQNPLRIRYQEKILQEYSDNFNSL